MWVQSLVQEDPLGKEMETHSSILALEIPWTEEPGGLQSMGSQRIGQDLVTTQQDGSSLWEQGFLLVEFIDMCLNPRAVPGI